MKRISQFFIATASAVVGMSLQATPAHGALLTPLPRVQTSIQLSGEPGAWILDDDTRHFGTGHMHIVAGDTSLISLLSNTATGTWQILIKAPAGRTLPVGTPFTATRSGDNGGPTIEFTGEGRGCSDSLATIGITKYVRNSNGSLRDLVASFQHRCDTAAGRTSATISIISKQPVRITGEPGSFVADNANYLFFRSQVTNNQPVFPNEIGKSLRIGVRGTDGSVWKIDFSAVRGQRLIAGTYSNAQRNSFRDATHPGLDVSGAGRACNIVYGWFVVYRAIFNADGSARELDMKFVQRCESPTAPKTTGEIHIY